MKRPGLAEGFGAAVLCSILLGFAAATLSLVWPGVVALKVSATVITLLYMLYLLSRSEERVGRVVLVSVFTLVAVAAFLVSLGVLAHLMMLAIFIWLTRALYFYQSALCALADLAVSAVGVLALIWAWQSTHSVALSAWSFFLVQSLFVLVPPSFAHRSNPGGLTTKQFDDAYRAAHAAAKALVAS